MIPDDTPNVHLHIVHLDSPINFFSLLKSQADRDLN